MSSPEAAGWDYEVIEDLLTTQRMSSYRLATGNDLRRSFDLYEWNMRAASGVLYTVGMVEVVVRNTLDNELTNWSLEKGTPSWFEHAPLDSKGANDLKKAMARATRKKPTHVHGKVVAELSLGFWRYLVASRYLTSLWIPTLSHGFPNGHVDIAKRRIGVDAHMDRLMFVRNRAAHHEPLHKRDLQRDLRSAVELASWVHADAASWISAKSPIPEIASSLPR